MNNEGESKAMKEVSYLFIFNDGGMYENVAHCFCIYCGNVAILRSDGKRELFCEECRDKRFSNI